MPTKRTWRDHTRVEFLSAYQYHELLTGKVDYPMMRYDGYGDGHGKDLRAFIGPAMRMDWAAHRDALLAFWISGEASYKLPNRQRLVVVLRRSRHAPVGVVAPRGSSAAPRRRDRGGVPDAV